MRVFAIKRKIQSTLCETDYAPETGHVLDFVFLTSTRGKEESGLYATANV